MINTYLFYYSNRSAGAFTEYTRDFYKLIMINTLTQWETPEPSIVSSRVPSIVSSIVSIDFPSRYSTLSYSVVSSISS